MPDAPVMVTRNNQVPAQAMNGIEKGHGLAIN
jgi:hypothetical protein